MPKQVTIKIAQHTSYNCQPTFLDWPALPTDIEGLYLTRPIKSREEVTPDSQGWNVTHKSGWTITPATFKSQKAAQKFISQLLKEQLDFTQSIEHMQLDHKTYIAGIRRAWESTMY